MYLTTGIKQAIKIKHEKTTPKINIPKCSIKVSIIYPYYLLSI